jgi:hypothetical protein
MYTRPLDLDHHFLLQYVDLGIGHLGWIWISFFGFGLFTLFSFILWTSLLEKLVDSSFGYRHPFVAAPLLFGLDLFGLDTDFLPWLWTFPSFKYPHSQFSP